MLIDSSFKFVEIEKLNPLCSLYKIYICKPAKANGFTFTKEVLSNENMMITIPSSPIVAGFMLPEGKHLGGHTNDLVKLNGVLKRTSQVQAIGYVREQEAFWETYKDEEWLTCYGVIWTSYFSGLGDIDERIASGDIHQSMEIQMEYDKDKVVTNCYLEALCVLEGINPAFTGSTIVPVKFSKSDYVEQVKSLKEELENLNKYSTIDFSIPKEIKTFSTITLQSNNNLTSGCKYNLNYLLNNDHISPDKLLYMQKYFSNIHHRKTFSLNGDDVLLSWGEKLISRMKEIDKNGDEKMKSKEVFSKEDIASGDYTIKVDKSKDSISDDTWGDIDKTELRNKIIKAKNAKSLVKDVYMVVEDGWEDAPSEKLGYPVMQIKNDTAVYNKNALSSALAYANHPETGNKEVADKIIKIQKKLGLLEEEKKEGEKMAKFTKIQKEEFATKFCLTANQTISLMNDVCSAVTYEVEGGHTYEKYWISDFDDSYMYGYDYENGGNVAILFTVSDNGQIVADFENVKQAKSMNVWIVSDNEGYDDAEDDTTFADSMKAKCSKTEEMCNTRLSEMETKLTETEAKLGQQFAATTSLETALEDEKKISEERQKQIDELSAQLKAKDESEKMSKSKELMSKKEFKVFSSDEINEILESSKEKTYEDFETFAYAKLGKFAGNNFDYSQQDGKFSYMYVPLENPNNKNLDSKDDVYAEIRKKKNNATE